jgi:hypothetical protein
VGRTCAPCYRSLAAPITSSHPPPRHSCACISTSIAAAAVLSFSPLFSPWHPSPSPQLCCCSCALCSVHQPLMLHPSAAGSCRQLSRTAGASSEAEDTGHAQLYRPAHCDVSAMLPFLIAAAAPYRWLANDLLLLLTSS